MKSRHIFQSKVARRIFTLFIISSLIPVMILAFLSLLHVSSISSEQVISRLKQDAKTYGFTIYDRVRLLEDELSFHASVLNTRDVFPEENTMGSSHLSEWRLFTYEGRKSYLQNAINGAPEISDGEFAHMKKGLSVLSVVYNQIGPPSLYISRIINLKEQDVRILMARIHPEYLWGDPDRFSGDVSACVLDAAFVPLHCTNSATNPIANSLHPNNGMASQSAALNEDAKNMLTGRWVLFMQPNYFTSKWHLLLYQNRQLALSQLKQFSGIYLIVIFLALLLVALLSIHLIRRNAVPLEAVIEGIRKISSNKFNTKVKVDSNDEYMELADALNSMSARIGNQINRLTTQASIDRLILTRPSIEDITNIARDGINQLLPCAWVVLATLEDVKSHVFHLRGGLKNLDENSVSRYITFDSEMIDLAMKGDSILITASSGDLRLRFHQAKIPEYNYYLLLPVVNVDELIGLFILGFNEKPKQNDIEHGLEFSNRIAVAFANAAWEVKLYNQAHYDLLTTLPNRASLEERLEKEISLASRADECVAILFLDLDRFKNVNDSLGHEFGDAVLKELSRRLKLGLREEDIVARLGGDEFIILLRGLKSPDMAVSTATSVAEKVNNLIALPIVLDEHEIRMTTSIGISVYPTDANNLNTMLRNADSAMYHAKDEDRGSFQFYSEEMNAAASYRLQMETKLHRAIEENAFELFYQPKINSKTQTIVGCEALIRWMDEDGEMIPPIKFISVAEDIGLTTIIGEWALKTACKQAREWSLPVSVNISARHFHHGHLVKHVLAALNESNLDSKYLEIEITETTTMHNVEKTVGVLKSLKRVGVNISIDDFGTGYSSLNYLKNFPVDTLKIDRIFISNILLDKKNLAIVKSTIGLAHNLGLNVVAEGVETEEQKDILADLDCDVVQGFLYSQALPASEFVKLLRQDIRPKKYNKSTI